MPDCDQCGRTVDALHQCAACSGTFCEEHRQPLLHGCREPSGSTGADAGEDANEGDREASFATMVVLASAASVAVFLLVAAMAVGVLQPATVVGGDQPIGGPSETKTTTLAEEPFDDAEFRTIVLGAINDYREQQGSGRLAADDKRQPVADRMAREMARVRYFQNESATESDRFSVERRLQATDQACEREALGSYFMKTHYGQRMDTGDGITVYETTREVAENAARKLIDDTPRIQRQETFERHALGVHQTDAGGIYVVYVAC